jgi:uncharacterized membrane protein (DUF2068 family)
MDGMRHWIKDETYIQRGRRTLTTQAGNPGSLRQSGGINFFWDRSENGHELLHGFRHSFTDGTQKLHFASAWNVEQFRIGANPMSGPTAIRLAALLALGYGLWVLASGPIHLGAGASAMTVRLSAAHAVGWLIGLLSFVLAIGLWTRYAWAWWLALAAALFQGWRIVSAHLAIRGLAKMPSTTALVLLVLLVVFVVLLLIPKARATCSR